MIRLMLSHRFSSNIKQPIFDRLLLSAVARKFIPQIRGLVHRDLNFRHPIVVEAVFADTVYLVPGQTIFHHVIRVLDGDCHFVLSNSKRSDFFFNLLLLLLVFTSLLETREDGIFALFRKPSIKIWILTFRILHGTRTRSGWRANC